MTISLSKQLGDTHKPRALRKAAAHIRFLVARSAKVSEDLVKIDTEVNNYILSNAIKNRGKVKINVTKSGNVINIGLYGSTKNAKKPEAAKKGAAGRQKAEPGSKEPRKEAPHVKKANPEKPAEGRAVHPTHAPETKPENPVTKQNAGKDA